MLSTTLAWLTLRRRRWVAAVVAGALALAATGVGLGFGLSHRGGAPAAAAPVRTATPAPATPAPAPLAIAAPADTPPPDTSDKDAPPYTTVFDLDIAAVSLHLPVVSVAVKNGAMDAPFGPLSSPVWHEAFWLNLGAEPGQPGTVTLAGHLDDTLGRPAAFWTVRSVTAGDVVTLTRHADGSVSRYKISEVHAYTDAVANSPATLARLYGTVGGGTADGVARIALITCTGRFVHGEYDHRFLAFGELLPPGSSS